MCHGVSNDSMRSVVSRLARSFRYRSERLRDDMMSIQLRHTTLEQLDPLLGSWSAFVVHVDPCSNQHCDLRIWIRHPIFMLADDSKLLSPFLHLYRLLGGRAAGVIADVNVPSGTDLFGARHNRAREESGFLAIGDEQRSGSLRHSRAGAHRRNGENARW